jgi:hypothetical protein
MNEKWVEEFEEKIEPMIRKRLLTFKEIDGVVLSVKDFISEQLDKEIKR